MPNSANGKLKIDNTEFLEEYKDHNSPIYQTITREIEDGLMEAFKDYKTAHVKVLNLTWVAFEMNVVSRKYMRNSLNALFAHAGRVQLL